MSNAFQTAVKSNVQYDDRLTALDRLAEANDTQSLRLFVQLDGMGGDLRRQALYRLADCGASAELERLANDRTLDPSLRSDAAYHQ